MTPQRAMRFLAGLSVLGSLCLRAQGPGPNATASGATLSGHVYLADTNGPARFSKVLLKAVAPEDRGEDVFSMVADSAIMNMNNKAANGSKPTSDDEAEIKATKSAASKLMGDLGDMLVSATVAADGSYTFSNVTPGTYYVHVKAPGYVDPYTEFSGEELASKDVAVQKRVLSAVTTVTLAGNDAVQVDLRLERGASISGRVLYDDGSPAVGWTVRAIKPGAPVASSSFGLLGIDLSELDLTRQAESVTTDDTGHYRLSGLRTGDFVVQARLTTAALDHNAFAPISSTSGSILSAFGGMSGLMGLKLTVYSGNATLLGDAKPVHVHAGEERSGVDLSMPLHATHSISGTVHAKADGHAVNGGTVELTAQDANGKPDASLHLSATVHADGSFRFDYVPGSATYQLRTLHSADASTVSMAKMFGASVAERKTLRRYVPLTVQVNLGESDLTGVRLEVASDGTY